MNCCLRLVKSFSGSLISILTKVEQTVLVKSIASILEVKKHLGSNPKSLFMSAQRRIQKCFLFLCPLLYRKARQLPRISPIAYLVSSDLHLFSMAVLVCKFVFYFQSCLSPYRCFKEKSRDNTLGCSSQLPSQAVILLKSFVIISKDIHF